VKHDEGYNRLTQSRRAAKEVGQTRGVIEALSRNRGIPRALAGVYVKVWFVPDFAKETCHA